MTLFAALRKGLAVAAALAIVATLGNTSANASTILDVTYKTTGVFLSGDTPNTNVFTTSGGDATVTYNGITENTVQTPSGAIFGAFVPMSMTSNVPVSSGFELTIEQVNPTAGTTLFTATLAGTLSINSSQASIKFDNIGPMEIGVVRYLITNADFDGTGPSSGLINLNQPGQSATINGFVTAVPEPASLAMVGLGLIGIPGLMFAQRRRRNTTA